MLALAAAVTTGSGVALAQGESEAAPSTAYVRVNQVGYLVKGQKLAYVLAPTSAAGATFSVRATNGSEVATGTVGPNTGRWSDQFRFVHRVDLSSVTTPGTYTIRVTGPVAATSPRFKIDSAAALYSGVIADGRLFFAAQRDGPDVDPSVLDRKPSHLNDAKARPYKPPPYNDDDELVGPLERVEGGPIDVSGGWFDAGDFVKFVQTHSYAVTLLEVGVRDRPAQMGGYAAEARFGLEWLLKMWDDETRTLYYQVGIGDADGCETTCADHDLWRLPELDDSLQGSKNRFLRNRPALRAGKPGAKVSPNLAGRLTAAFSVCAQNFRETDRALADRCLASAQHVYALADKQTGKDLLSVSPHGFYPEESWRDDMELGATELHRALAAYGDPDAPRLLADAARWARSWNRSDQAGGDTLNLYDVSALAHYELSRAIAAAGNPAGLVVTRTELLTAIKEQLDGAVKRGGQDPFGAGFSWDQYDVTSHLLGLITSADLYRELSGKDTYGDFARRQLAAALGANAWGVSLIIGAGTTFPHCPQHVVANLSGSLDGRGEILRGAVVNGPNDESQFEDSSSTPDNGRACPADGVDRYLRFTGDNGARFQDNVGAWMSVEPAIDFTAMMPLALSRLVAADPGQ